MRKVNALILLVLLAGCELDGDVGHPDGEVRVAKAAAVASFLLRGPNDTSCDASIASGSPNSCQGFLVDVQVAADGCHAILPYHDLYAASRGGGKVSWTLDPTKGYVFNTRPGHTGIYIVRPAESGSDDLGDKPSRHWYISQDTPTLVEVTAYPNPKKAYFNHCVNVLDSKGNPCHCEDPIIGNDRR